jgi:anti-sigma regulatory factor (Ser/Thr protein kinase)
MTATARDVDASLALPASLDSLGVARSTLERALRDTGWDLASASPVMLAAGEAVANAIVHGSAPGAGVRVGLEVTPERARVRVVDEGRDGAVVPACPPELPDDTSLSGRGLYIMRAVADVCSVRTGGHGTEVVLEFRRAA